MAGHMQSMSGLKLREMQGVNFRMLKEGLALQSHRIIILKEWNSNGNLDFENIIKLFLP